MSCYQVELWIPTIDIYLIPIVTRVEISLLNIQCLVTSLITQLAACSCSLAGYYRFDSSILFGTLMTWWWTLLFLLTNSQQKQYTVSVSLTLLHTVIQPYIIRSNDKCPVCLLAIARLTSRAVKQNKKKYLFTKTHKRL